MPWEKLDIINLAFNKLNKSSVQQLADAGVFADSAATAYDLLMPSTISSKSWRFATKVRALDQLPISPPVQFWTYAYQLPVDYLAAVRTFPFAMDFQIYEQEFWCNTNQVQLEYRFVPDPTKLPAYFVHYFAVILAAWFADAVAENDSLAAKLSQEAQIQLDEALFTDSQSHPTPAMRNNPIIQSRFGWWYGADRAPNT